MRNQAITAVASDIQIPGIGSRFEGGAKILNASIQRLDPAADETSDDELDLGLVGHESPPFHKVIAQPSEPKALPVVTEIWAQVHAEIAIGHDRGVAVPIANRHVDHMAGAKEEEVSTCC